MWGRPLICKTEMQLTEVEPPPSHSPQSTFAQAHSIQANVQHDPSAAACPAGGRTGRTVWGKTSVRGRPLIVRNCQLTSVSKCQSGLISTESPSNLKHLSERRALRESRRAMSGKGWREREEGKVEEGEIRNNYCTCLFSQCQRQRCIIQSGWMANAGMAQKKGGHQSILLRSLTEGYTCLVRRAVIGTVKSWL